MSETEDLAWEQLRQGLKAERDDRDWLHVTISGRTFSLMRTVLGTSTLVVANSVFADEAELDPVAAARASASWPVGSLVLHDDRWLSRHVFSGIPTHTQAIDVLRGLAFQVRPLSPAFVERSRRNAFAAYSHFAD